MRSHARRRDRSCQCSGRPGALTQVVPISGKSTKGNKQFSGTYTIERFIAKGGKLYSVGTVEGQARQQEGHQEERPAAGDRRQRQRARPGRRPGPAGPPVPPLPLPPLPAGNACSILALDLGPINLNVLGLVVRTNQIQLRIDAVQGPGNLLGNLLCGITGILNPGGALANTPLGQLAQILNALLALSPRTA